MSDEAYKIDDIRQLGAIIQRKRREGKSMQDIAKETGFTIRALKTVLTRFEQMQGEKYESTYLE